VIGDAVIAIGLYIAFYYGLTGFARVAGRFPCPGVGRSAYAGARDRHGC